MDAPGGHNLMTGGADPILEHLARFGVTDKDRVRPGARSPATASKAGKPAFDRILDLHGLTSGQAERKLRAALAEAKRRGWKRMLVIHGRGTHSDPAEGAVLQNLVRTMLDGSCRPLIRNFSGASPRHGGEGAVVVRF